MLKYFHRFLFEHQSRKGHDLVWWFTFSPIAMLLSMNLSSVLHFVLRDTSFFANKIPYVATLFIPWLFYMVFVSRLKEEKKREYFLSKRSPTLFHKVLFFAYAIFSLILIFYSSITFIPFGQ